MSTKSFKAAPKPGKLPSDDQIAAFEKGGTGTDRPKSPASSTASSSDEPTKRLSLDLPASMHTRFKTACSATNRKMIGEVAALIEKRTAELEAEAGISRD